MCAPAPFAPIHHRAADSAEAVAETAAMPPGQAAARLALAAGLAAAGAPATAQLRIADEPPPGFEDLVAPGPEAATPAESGLRLSDEPPPGFEDLLEPETAPIDVYVGGRAIGSYLATFHTPDDQL